MAFWGSGIVGTGRFETVVLMLLVTIISLNIIGTRALAIANAIASITSKAPVINYSMVLGNAAGNAIAGMGKRCTVRTGGKRALLFRFVKCGRRDEIIGSTELSVEVGTSRITLRRYIIINCKAQGAGTVADTGVTVYPAPTCSVYIGARRCNSFRRGNFGRITSTTLSAFSVSMSTTSCDGVHQFIGGNRLPPMSTIHARRLIGCFSCSCPGPAKGSPIGVAVRTKTYP